MTRADGNIIIKADVDVSEADKELGKLKKSIGETEEEIKDLTKKKEASSEKSVFSAAELDAEKAKLSQMKRELEEIRAISKDTSLSDSVRAEAKQSIPDQKFSVSEQQARVDMLQTEYTKVANAVDRYSARLDEAKKKLDKQTTRAGELVEQINSVSRASQYMAKAKSKAQKSMDRFGLRLREVTRSALIFTVISRAFSDLRDWTGKVIRANDEAKKSIAELKASLLTLAQPLVESIIPMFTMFVNMMTQAITVAGRLASAGFGKSYEESRKSAQALNKETAALEGVSAAAKKAAGSLAGFDEINSISTETAGTIEPILPDFSAIAELPVWLENIVTDLEITIRDLRFDWDNGMILESKNAWIVALTSVLSGVIGGIFGGFNGIFIGLILGAGIGLGAVTFANKLANSEQAKEMFLVVLGAILGAVIGSMFGGLPGMSIGLFMGMSIGLIGVTFLDKLKNSESAKDIFVVVLGSILGAVIGAIFGGIPGMSIALVMGASISLVGVEFLDELKNAGDAKDAFFVVLGAILGAVIGAKFGGLPGSVIGLLLGALITLVSLEFAKGDASTWDGKDTIVVILSAILGAVIGSMFGGLVGGAIGLLLGATISFIAIKFSEGKYNKDKAIASLRVVLMAMLGLIVGTMFGGIAGGVIGLMLGLTIGFSSVAFDENLKASVRSTAEKAFKVALTTIIGALIGAAIGGVFGGIAGGIIGLTLGLAITLNDAKVKNKNINVQGNGMFGGEVSLNRSVPALATGAVVPPNREFMAILGDNKQETEVVSPLSTMKQAVLEALQEAGGIGGGTVTVVVNLDGKEVARNTVKHVNDMTRQAGKPVLLV